MATTTRFLLNELSENQAGADVTYNQNIVKLDQLVGGAVTVKSTTTTPPGSPADGDCYLTGTGSTGAWGGHDNNIALYLGGWIFIAVVPGTLIFDKNTVSLKCCTSGSTYHMIF